MVHSVYSDRDHFLRELISNAANACDELHFEAIADPALLGADPKARTTVVLDAGAGASRSRTTASDEPRREADALGTIARSGTKAFMDPDRASAERQGAQGEGAQLIGPFEAHCGCHAALDPMISGFRRTSNVYIGIRSEKSRPPRGTRGWDTLRCARA